MAAKRAPLWSLARRRAPGSRARLAALALLAAPLAACSGGSASSRPEVVVWIGVDTLRADALSCYGARVTAAGGAPLTPEIDALAASGVRFARAYSVAPWTIPSLSTLLTGKWPWEHGGLRLLRPLGEGNVTLPESFQKAGWTTAGVMTNFVATGKYGFAQGFDRWDDSLALGHEGSHGTEAAAKLLAFADELEERGAKKLFLFLFLFEPHFRYEAHPEYGVQYEGVDDDTYRGELRGDESINDLLARRATLTEDDARFLRARYHAEVAEVDRAVGVLRAGLEQRGLWDDALVAFVADHGEEILDKGWIGYSIHFGDELVRVPYVVRPPAGVLPTERVGAVIDAPVSTIAFRDTLMDLAGLDLAGVDAGRESLGRTVLDGAHPARRFLFLHTDFEPPLPNSEEKRSHVWGVVDAEQRLKWTVDHNPGEDQPPRLALYDVDADPLEEHNLLEQSDQARALESFKKTRELWLFQGLLPEPLKRRDPTRPHAPPPGGR